MNGLTVKLKECTKEEKNEFRDFVAKFVQTFEENFFISLNGYPDKNDVIKSNDKNDLLADFA